jgi:hypothetical protein
MKNCLKIVSALALSVGMFAAVGCSDAVDEITNSIDCKQVCQRYADCFKSDYDVDGCADKCENSADNDEDRERKLETCNACIDDRSCTDATFNCADDCLGIVP